MPQNSNPAPRIVVLDDEVNMGKVLTKLLTLEGYDVRAFSHPREALDHLALADADLLLTDLRMPDLTGEEVLTQLREQGNTCEVIVTTAYGTVESAMNCVRQGAFDYITKPWDTRTLLTTVRRALDRRAKTAGQAPFVPPVSRSSTVAASDRELVGESAEMAAVRDLIRRVAPSEATILITGESGTGKELVARALHRQSPRAAARFLAINCASIPESLIESELFGHERGSFTGATETKIGLLEAANGGTVFLDEIGELPLTLQPKLLRALQEREIVRVGSHAPIPIDVRILAATNRKLLQCVEQGTFREDLYYRLAVLTIRLPGLRKRPGDIRVLAEHFLAEFRAKMQRPALKFSEEMLAHLESQPWPGNVRELRNYIERLAVLAERDVIDKALLNDLSVFESQTISPNPPGPGQGNSAPIAPISPDAIPEFRDARDQFEADYIRSVLKAVGGNVSEASRKAGMSRRNFYEKLEKLGITLEEFK